MAAGGGAGVITVWNLEDRRLHTIVKVQQQPSLSSPLAAASSACCFHPGCSFWSSSPDLHALLSLHQSGIMSSNEGHAQFREL